MNRSEQIDELVTALAKAQGIMPAVLKDKVAEIRSEKGNYSYNYADVATVLDAIRKPMADNGLALIQTVDTSDGVVIVETMLAHASGQWISHAVTLRAMGSDARAVGSAITYGRRYGLIVTGVVTDDDDDGAAATTKTAHRQPAPQRAPAPQPAQPEPAGWDDLKGHSEQPAPASGNGNGHSAGVKPARLLDGSFGPAFVALVAKLDGAGIAHPYRKTSGGLDYDHAQRSATACGFTEIGAANVGKVISALERRVIAKAQASA